MSGLPRRLAAGVSLTAAWLNRLLDYLRSRELIAGPGIRLSRTPSGTTISAGAAAGAAAAAAPDVVPAVVTSGSGGVYRVDLYANGLLSPRTGQGRLVVPEVSMLQTLDAGSVVLAHLVTVEVLDHGMESSDWAEDGDGEEE